MYIALWCPNSNLYWPLLLCPLRQLVLEQSTWRGPTVQVGAGHSLTHLSIQVCLNERERIQSYMYMYISNNAHAVMYSFDHRLFLITGNI